MLDPESSGATALPRQQGVRPEARRESLGAERDELRCFARFWALAALAHVAGNLFYANLWPQFSLQGLVLALLGLLATATLLWPSRLRLTLLCALGVVALGVEGPMWSNHWLLAGLVSLAWLGGGGRWPAFRANAQWLLLVFYAFAAFAKLNRGFFDPSHSAAVFHAGEMALGFGLNPPLPGRALSHAIVWITAAVELAVVPLLLLPRTRLLGVWLGCAFHGLLSLDMRQHFYDFTAVLVALFVLFLEPGWSRGMERGWRRLGRRARWAWIGAVLLAGLAITAVNGLAAPEASSFWTRIWFVGWIPLTVVAGREIAAARAAGPIQPPRGAGIALVVLSVVNGLTPYLEIKTVASWQMYSNLTVLDGESNHLLVRRGWPLRPWHAQPVEILDSSAPELRLYARQRQLIPWPTLRCYLVRHPDISLRYRRGGVERSVARVGSDPELGAPLPWWWPWLPLRSFSARNPEGVQAEYLPAL